MEVENLTEQFETLKVEALLQHANTQQEEIAKVVDAVTHANDSRSRLFGVLSDLSELFGDMRDQMPENLQAQFNERYEAAMASACDCRNCSGT